jgi:UDP-N-acetylmuramoylalanine--D-glutamate ligase
VVIEVSSFQLEEIVHFKPYIAVLLNVTPDHLDRYASMADYFSAKLNLVRNQEKGDYLVLNRDDPVLWENSARAGGFGAAQKVWFSCRGRDADAYAAGGYIHVKPAEKISLAGNPLRGMHNLENILAAVAAARLAGAQPAKIEAALRDFKGLAHRMESLGKIGKVEFINDSKATNVDAALKSIAGIHGPMVVILGGKDKGGDFKALEKTIAERVDTVLLVGQAAAAIRGQLPALEKKFHPVKDLGEAAAEGFKRLEKKGGVVLLAPACASFDMFKNFEHRGEVFKEEFLKLKKKYER